MGACISKSRQAHSSSQSDEEERHVLLQTGYTEKEQLFIDVLNPRLSKYPNAPRLAVAIFSLQVALVALAAFCFHKFSPTVSRSMTFGEYVPEGQICESTVSWDRVNRYVTKMDITNDTKTTPVNDWDWFYIKAPHSAALPSAALLRISEIRVILRHHFVDIADILHTMSYAKVYARGFGSAQQTIKVLRAIADYANLPFNISFSRVRGSGWVIKRQTEKCKFEGCSCKGYSYCESNGSLWTNTTGKWLLHCYWDSMGGKVFQSFQCLEKEPEHLFEFSSNDIGSVYNHIRQQRFPCVTQVPCSHYHCAPGYKVKRQDLCHKFKRQDHKWTSTWWKYQFKIPQCSEGEYEVVEIRSIPWWKCFSLAMGYLSFVEMVATATVLAMYFTYASGTCCWCNKSKLQDILKVAMEAQTEVELQHLRAGR